MLTGKDQHKSFKKLITPQIRIPRAQKSSAKINSMGSFKGKQNFEPLPLITMFFSVMRHREKTNKQECKYWRLQAVVQSQGSLRVSVRSRAGNQKPQDLHSSWGLEGVSTSEDQVGQRVQG